MPPRRRDNDDERLVRIDVILTGDAVASLQIGLTFEDMFTLHCEDAASITANIEAPTVRQSLRYDRSEIADLSLPENWDDSGSVMQTRS
jgi:hypothetical protein